MVLMDEDLLINNVSINIWTPKTRTKISRVCKKVERNFEIAKRIGFAKTREDFSRNGNIVDTVHK